MSKPQKPKEFEQYLERPDGIMPAKDYNTLKELEAGVYEACVTPRGEVYFKTKTFNHDVLLDLPESQYADVMAELEVFLSPEAKERFKETGLLYKSSLILYGRQGTGKTSIVMQVAKRVIQAGGIVLFDPNVKILKPVYRILSEIEPERFVLVILEEFDQISEHQEEELLNVLDGENQRKNTMVIGTTNHIDKISKRLLRPGRFQNKIEVFEPSAQARRYYLSRKLKDQKAVEHIVEKTNKFTIDELCEVVRSHYCLGHSIDKVIGRIKGQSNLGSGQSTRLAEEFEGEPYDSAQTNLQDDDAEEKPYTEQDRLIDQYLGDEGDNDGDNGN